MVTWGAVKGAREQGRSSRPLTAPHVTSNRAGNEAKRSSVELRFLSGFGFQVFSSYGHAFGNASELSASIIPVRSQKYIDRRFVAYAFLKVLLATTTLTRLLSALLRSHMWARCTLGFDLKPGPITTVTEPGWLGAAI